jgi:hypothetical protein
VTDTLALAGALRSWDDDRLRTLLSVREVPDDAHIADLFDLAEYLLDRARLEATVRRLDRRVLVVLTAAAQLGRPFAFEELLALIRETGDTEWSEAALRAARESAAVRGLLIEQDLDVPLDSVAAALRAVSDRRALSLSALLSEPRPRLLAATDDHSAAEALAAERAFLASARTGDLLDALLRQPARELGRGGLSLPDARRLSSIVGTDVAAVGPLVELAAAAGLIALEERSWLVTRSGLAWMDRGLATRWRTLAESWLASISPEMISVLTTSRHGHLGGRLDALAHWWFPLGGDWLATRITRLAARSEVLGLTVDGVWSPAGVTLLGDGADAAAATLAPSLPQEVDKVYVQNDLTIIAPGPLLPEIDRTLRGIADLESRSHASSYRISPSSVGRALSNGSTRESILAFLRGISSTGLPQPVEYVVSEAAARHGLVRVGPFAQRTGVNAAATSYVRSTDRDYLAAIAVDQNLTPLALVHATSPSAAGPSRLVSRFAPDVVFWALQEARYPVAAESADGQIVRLGREHLASEHAPSEPIPHALVERLRSATDGTGDDEATDAAWLSRQLDEAVKRRNTITIVVRFPDGSDREFRLEATGLSGGRLRGRDAQADVERTVPIGSIVSVLPG